MDTQTHSVATEEKPTAPSTSPTTNAHCAANRAAGVMEDQGQSALRLKRIAEYLGAALESPQPEVGLLGGITGGFGQDGVAAEPGDRGGARRVRPAARVPRHGTPRRRGDVVGEPADRTLPASFARAVAAPGHPGCTAPVWGDRKRRKRRNRELIPLFVEWDGTPH